MKIIFFLPAIWFDSWENGQKEEIVIFRLSILHAFLLIYDLKLLYNHSYNYIKSVGWYLAYSLLLIYFVSSILLFILSIYFTFIARNVTNFMSNPQMWYFVATIDNMPIWNYLKNPEQVEQSRVLDHPHCRSDSIVIDWYLHNTLDLVFSIGVRVFIN
jgi:hypothetical protein